VTRPYQVDHVKVIFLYNQIGVCMDEVESWAGAPMTYSWLLSVVHSKKSSPSFRRTQQPWLDIFGL
jgi:hypothetical protein